MPNRLALVARTAMVLNLWSFLNFFCHDGCIVRDGVWGWNRWHNLSLLADRWSEYDDGVSGDGLWALDTNKRVKKLYNNDTETNKGQDGYNSSYKFDYIWWCLIHGVKFLTKHEKLDICGDDTSRATSSYGEAGSGLTGWIFNRTGITKGDQKVPVSDAHHIRLCAYRHRHELHVLPPGCNVWVKIEVKEIMDAMNIMVEGEVGGREKNILWTPTLIAGTINSVGDQIINWLWVGMDFGDTITCGRYR